MSFFYFQAEDGIRDFHVTGVQTCALPISVVQSTQRAAQASLEWFENLGRYTHQEPMQFAFNLMTRSRRVTYDNLRLRDPQFVSDVDGRSEERRVGKGSTTRR